MKKRKSGKRKKGLNAGLRAYLNKKRAEKKSHTVKPKRQKRAKAKRSTRRKGRIPVKSLLKHAGKRTRRVGYVMPNNVLKMSPYKKHAFSSIVNPFHFGKKKHKKISHRRKNKGVSFMKNPLNAGVVKNVLKEVPSALYAGAGYLGTDMLMKLPVVSTFALESDYKRIGAKIAGVIVLGIGSKMLLKKPEITKMVILGGTLNVIGEIGKKTGLTTMLTGIGAGTAGAGGTAEIINDSELSTLINSNENNLI